MRLNRPDVLVVDGFSVLGWNASAAAGPLAEIMNERQTPEISVRAMECLVRVGPAAEVYLRSASTLDDPDPWVRETATNLLISFGLQRLLTNGVSGR